MEKKQHDETTNKIINDLIQFLSTVTPTYLDWLKQNGEDFPYCCTLASEVIGSYITEHFCPVNLVHGSFEIDDEDMYTDESGDEPTPPFHAWLENNDFIIDFTAFQFITETGWELLSGTDLMKFVLQKQEGILLFPEAELFNKYQSEETYYCNRFSSYTKEANFLTYLSLVEESPEFKNYKWEDIMVTQKLGF